MHQSLSVCVILSTFLWLLLLHQCQPATAVVHRTLDEARAARQQLVQKHLKRRQKADGALKLVGGAGDYEGGWLHVYVCVC